VIARLDTSWFSCCVKKDIAESPFPKAVAENGRVTMSTVAVRDPVPATGRERKASPLEYDLEDIEEANRLDASLRRQHAS
jgi:hypothetical protein